MKMGSMPSKKYYAYFLSEKIQGVCETWSECEKIVKGKEARYRGFKTENEAKEWLKAGAKYKEPGIYPHTKRKVPLGVGVYFDAGTGRGMGVEISVTDEKGANLLHKIMPKNKINQHGKHLISDSVTNNYGELLACYYALKLALKKKTLKIFGDSKLVVEYWSKGFIKRKTLPAETIKLAEKVIKLRKHYEDIGGKVGRVSGDDNPADLGFH